MIIAVVKRVIVLSDNKGQAQRLLKIECPFCRQEHTHGGGFTDSDIQQWNGSRVCHCSKLEHVGKYYSLEIPEGVPHEYK